MSSETINLAEHFAFSDKFSLLFSDGMSLVEESASYLDGPGRAELKNLDRSVSTLYGTESMRLTTRLMQVASWLLLQRAANQGEMTREQLLDEKKKVKLELEHDLATSNDWQKLPTDFRILVERSLILQKRIITLDREVYKPSNKIEDELTANNDNPVQQQLTLLSAALGAR